MRYSHRFITQPSRGQSALETLEAGVAPRMSGGVSLCGSSFYNGTNIGSFRSAESHDRCSGPTSFSRESSPDSDDAVPGFRRGCHLELNYTRLASNRMRRHTLDAIANDDSVPVMVPRNVKTLVPIPPERVRRLRRHLLVVLRGSPTSTAFERPVSPVWPEPEGFVACVARAACAMCEGWCCKNGEDDGFLDEQTVARVRHSQETLTARAVLRLYVERVPEAGYQGSCIFHGKQGCTLDRSLRSAVCNSYFCGGLHDYMASGGPATPVTVIAGEGDKLRTSPVLTP
jgi:hypothetical protein